MILGKRLETLKILQEELKNYNRNVFGVNSKQVINRIFQEIKIDMVVVGARLTEEERIDYTNFILDLNPDIVIHIIEKKAESTPADMINFVNDKVIMYKIEKSLVLN